MKQAMETIQKRVSVRTFDGKPLDPATLEKLEELCRAARTGPFGNPVRFRLLDLRLVDREELRRLGTYGVIKGASLYILSAVREGERCLEDLGFCMERVILEATAMGLGTCWLAGTFRRSSFAAQMELAPGELLPAITPVGRPAARPSLTEKAMRYGAGSRRRKPWTELFFSGDGKTPLTENDAGSYREALEAVRLGPSASNRQPWRLVRDSDGLFHLYLKENRIYNRALGKIRVQHIDMGIAMCHFSLVAAQRGLKGRWERVAVSPGVTDLEYIATWLPEPGKG